MKKEIQRSEDNTGHTDENAAELNAVTPDKKAGNNSNSLNIQNKKNEQAIQNFKTIDPKKMAAVENAMSQLKKSFGPGAAMFLNSGKIEDINSISTGSLYLDQAIGIGGIPRGRITEIHGQASAGKTTLALHILKTAQQEGGLCAFIDAEHALNIKYAAQIGIDISKTILSQPDSGEQALETVETLARSGGVDLIIVDSVAALVPKAELEGNMEDAVMGGQARLMSKALRKLTSIIHSSDTALVFINQTRMKMGMVPTVLIGNPEATSGGNALKFYASLILKLKTVELIKNKSGEIIGQVLQIKVSKNKFASPFKVVTITFLYSRGIDRYGELVDMCVDFNIIQKSGSWFAYGDQKIGQGRDSVIDLLYSDEKLFNELLNKVLPLLQA